ncbi:MAG: tripartite tricarboxylate transporter TctB family protein [Burkholderiales bacterium]|nr:tripartite tricarboxylate transporter TctB family protein [Burkholderiales bacterium]
MSERIFGAMLLLLSIAGVYIGWDLKAPVSYEPVGPNTFPVLVFSLLALCAVGLMVTQRSPTQWPPAHVLRRILGMFLVILAYAWLFDRLGFVLSTFLMTIPLARAFGSTWMQAVAGALGMSLSFYFIFDRLLDVALPAGRWLKPLLG